MIRISLQNAPEVSNGLRARALAISESLTERVTFLDLKVQQTIVHEKLSGQVLQHRTGVLAGSITAEPAEIEGGKIVGQISGAGGPAWYGRVHEYGGEKEYDIEPVNAQALHFMASGKEVFTTHVHHLPLPERSFMRITLEEMHGEIVASLEEAMVKALRAGA